MSTAEGRRRGRPRFAMIMARSDRLSSRPTLPDRYRSGRHEAARSRACGTGRALVTQHRGQPQRHRLFEAGCRFAPLGQRRRAMRRRQPVPLPAFIGRANRTIANGIEPKAFDDAPGRRYRQELPDTPGSRSVRCEARLRIGVERSGAAPWRLGGCCNARHHHHHRHDRCGSDTVGRLAFSAPELRA